MTESNNILDRNRELAHKILAEAKDNPQSPYHGKKIGIANGQLVAVADTWKEVMRCLHETESDPRKMYCVEEGVDYSQIQEIWRVVDGSCPVASSS